MNRAPYRFALLLIPFALRCFALLPQARAVCQEGCDLTNGNTFLGDDALSNDTAGNSNTAIGSGVLLSNTSGEFNTATGFGALFSNTTGYGNTAIGAEVLNSNTTGIFNTAIGNNALLYSTTGNYNTATGLSALYQNTTGSYNTANGNFALSQNTTASSNTATGYEALWLNTTGYRNTAMGYGALSQNTTGHGNAAIGFQALYETGAGSNNIGLGFNAGSNLTNGNGNVCIGYNVLGVAGESNTIRISNIYFSAASGRAVYINSDNKIGTLVSSRRFKEEIKPMDKASEAILALKPVTFHYKKEIDRSGALMFGLVAEDVEKVDPDLVTRNDKGEAETVRYEAINAMLLNEFLKEHSKVEKQEATINELRSMMAQQQKDFQSTIAQLTRRLDEQASQIQKVSAQFEVTGQARQMISSNR